MILYLHGFGSSGNAFKARLLRRFFPDVSIASPDLPIEPDRAIQSITQFIRENASGKILLIGSSLGGFYAQHLSHEHRISAILLNPAVYPWQNLNDRIGDNVRADNTSQHFEWMEKYLKQLHALYRKPADYQKDLLHVYLNKDDEVLDFREAENEFRSIGCAIQISAEGGHVFTNFAKIRQQIATIYHQLLFQ